MVPVNLIAIGLVILLIGVLSGALIAHIIAGKRLHATITNYEEQLRNLTARQSREITRARAHSVNASRYSLKGQIGEQMAPLLPEFPYLPSDARFLGYPVDYIVFSGYSALRDNPGEGCDGGDQALEIVFVEIKSGQARSSLVQKQIAKAILAGRVRFEVVQILRNHHS